MTNNDSARVIPLRKPFVGKRHVTETLATLGAARALISNPKRWTQGVPARNATGDSVSIESSYATCWCVTGALVKTSASAASRLRAISTFESYLYLYDSIVPWNDNPRRTHAQVMSVFDSIIARLEA